MFLVHVFWRRCFWYGTLGACVWYAFFWYGTLGAYGTVHLVHVFGAPFFWYGAYVARYYGTCGMYAAHENALGKVVWVPHQQAHPHPRQAYAPNKRTCTQQLHPRSVPALNNRTKQAYAPEPSYPGSLNKRTRTSHNFYSFGITIKHYSRKWIAHRYQCMFRKFKCVCSFANC